MVVTYGIVLGGLWRGLLWRLLTRWLLVHRDVLVPDVDVVAVQSLHPLAVDGPYFAFAETTGRRRLNAQS